MQKIFSLIILLIVTLAFNLPSFQGATFSTNPDNVTCPTNANFLITIGCVASNGTSTYPWHDVTSIADVNLLSSLMTNAPTETTQIPGTCTIPSTSPNQLSGAGNPAIGNVLTASSYGGVAVVCSLGNFTSADIGNYLALNWDSQGDSSYKGRFAAYINSVPSSTIAVLSAYSITEPYASFATGLNAYRLSTPTAATTDYGPYNLQNQGGHILNFYEAGLAVYRTWEATGNTTYQTLAHNFCDNTWYWSADSGYNGNWGNSLGFNSPMLFLTACATDPTYTKPANMLDGIARLVLYNGPELPSNTSPYYTWGYSPTIPVTLGGFDPRYNSYDLRTTSELISIGGTPNYPNSTLCTWLSNQITNVWLNGYSSPVGAPSNTYAYIPENITGGSFAVPGASIPSVTGVLGTSPWRSNGLPALAIESAYSALNTCGSTSLANQLFTSGGNGSGLIPQMVNFVYNYGISQDGGLFAAAGYPNDTQGEDSTFVAPPTYNSFVRNAYSISATFTNGSPTVTGSSGNISLTGYTHTTVFSRMFWSGGTLEGPDGNNYTISAIPNDYTITLSTNYAGSTTSSNYFGLPSTCTYTVTNASTTFHSNSTTCSKFSTQFTSGSQGNFNFACIQSTDVQYCEKIVSIMDDQDAVMETAWPGVTNAAVSLYYLSRTASTNCGPQSLATYCTWDLYGTTAGRALGFEGPAAATWLYKKTGATKWKNYALFGLNKLAGGNSAGSGATSLPYNGSCTYNPGTISISSGGTVVTGVGTSFLTQFPNSSSFTAADGITSSYNWASGTSGATNWYTVGISSVSSNTSLTLSSAWPGASGSTSSNVFYNYQDPNWQCSDGGGNNLGSILPSCGSNSPPCGINYLTQFYGKQLGQTDGAGNMYLAISDLQNANSISRGLNFLKIFGIGIR